MSVIKANEIRTLDGTLVYKQGETIANDSVAKLSDLLVVNPNTKAVVNVLNYHTGLEGGGGVFYWDAAKPATEHNGGTVISPLVTYPADWDNQTQLAAWFAAPTSGVGCWVRQYDGAVDVKWFGAKGDGVTDDKLSMTKSLQTANAFVPKGNFLINSSLGLTSKGRQLFGEEGSIVTQGASNAYIIINGLNEVTIKGLKIVGTGASGGVQITGGATGVLIDNVYFYQGNQRVWLFSCDNIEVNSCTFENTGYGVIQQSGSSSSDVLVTNCLAFDMINDFVEANCENVKSYRWTVSNNIYRNNISFPGGGTGSEKRFAGFTEVEGVIITGNQIMNTMGDSAIHLEDLYGNTIISNNYFKDCVPSHGNSGYIYLLDVNSADDKVDDLIISNNIFIHSLSTVNACAYSQNSNYYANRTQFIGNSVKDISGAKTFKGCELAFSTADTLVANNIFYKLAYAIGFSGGEKVKFSSNMVTSCGSGVLLGRTATSSGGIDYTVDNNIFRDITDYDVFTSTNTNGTNSPVRWSVINNVISKNITVGDLGAGGSNSTQDTRIVGNILATGATISGSIGGSTNQIIANNIQGKVIFSSLLTYADNASAIAGGLQTGAHYKTSTGELRIVV